MNFAKKVLTSTKDFVTDNKVVVAIYGTAIVTITMGVIVSRALGNDYQQATEEFLTEKNLLEEFADRYLV